MMNLPSKRAEVFLGRFLLTRRIVATVCLLMAGLVASLNQASAQVPGGGFGLPNPGGQYPAQAYYEALRFYRDGDLDNAIRGFEFALRSTRTDINGKWIDSIPGRVMLAECHWQLGNLQVCRGHLDEAAGIAIRNRGWLGQLDFNSLNNMAAAVSPTNNLWPAVAAVRQIPVPRQLPFQSGRQLTEAGLAAGGVIETPTIRNIDGIEVMRTLAVLSHRRRVLMGPLSGDDAASRELVEATKVPSNLTHPIGRSLVYAMRGCEYHAIGEDKTTIDRAAKYAVVSGGVHPLTPMLLLCGLRAGANGDENGKLSPANAQTLISTAQQISNAAAAMDQFEFIGEALQVAVGVAQANQLSGVEQTAALAARTLVRQSRLASLHCYLVAADAAISAGRVEAASEHFQAATALAGRRDVQLPRLQAYGAYIGARLAAQSGQPIGIGNSGSMADALNNMVDFILNRRDRARPIVSMPFLYQTNLVMSSLGGNVGNQSIKRVLEGYAGEVGLSLWRQDPLNAMAAVYFNDSALHAALLNIATVENDGIGVLKQTDRLLAKRFTSQLPLQGRLLQYRTLATLPVNQLWPSAASELAEPSVILKRLRDQTQKSLIVPQAAQPGDKVSARPQSEALAMEAVVSELALSRSVAPEINPPRVASTDVALVPDGTALVTFVAERGRIHATATRDGATRTWLINGANRLPAMINRLLQDIGANRARGKRLPEDDTQWRSDATKIRSFLFPDSSGWTEDGLSKIVIVPDGSLWYLPFELLPAVGTQSVNDPADPAEQTAVPLWADSIEVQVAPTPGLALRDGGVSTTASRIAMVTNGFFAVRDPAMNQSMIDEVLSTAADAAKLAPAETPPTDRLAMEIGHLVVAASVTPNIDNPMSTQIIPLDNRASARGESDRLSDWVRMPAGAPQTVVLAGLRSKASVTQAGDGSELFFPMIALRASGVREVLLSRWPTGGQSAATFLTEIVNELPHTTLAEAVVRGRMILRSSDLSASREPLLGKPDEEHANLNGNEPLFWSTYFSSGSLELPAPDSED